MRFSIVTPVLNGMPWLPEAVASVDAQRADVEVEHLILDGGSTDGSRDWLREHASHTRLIFEPDGGQTPALIRGFRESSGDVLGWLNADDVLEPGALRRAAEALRRVPAATAVSGGCLLIDEDGGICGALPVLPGSSVGQMLMEDNALAQPATFFRREAYLAVGGLDPSFDCAMDVDLWFRLAERGEILLLKREVLARFRIHGSAKSARLAQRMAQEDLRVRQRYGLPPLSGVGRTLYARAAMPPMLRTVGPKLRGAVRDTLLRTPLRRVLRRTEP